MSQINAEASEFSGRPITDAELAVQLESCLQHRDPVLLSQIARSVVESHFPQISSEPQQKKRRSLLTFLQVWQRFGAPLSAEFKIRLDNCLGLLRQRRHARRH